MKTKDGFIQGYNAQAAVDATAQVIVAHGLDAKQSDQHQSVADRRRHRSQSGQEADATVGGRGLSLRRQPCGDGGTRDRRLHRAGAGEARRGRRRRRRRVAAMRERIKAGGTPARPLKKQLPELVFGQIKQARGFRQLLCAASRRSPTSGASSASPTISRSSPRGGPRPWPHSQPARASPPRKRCNERWPQSFHPYIKPDARICCIQLSDWL